MARIPGWRDLSMPGVWDDVLTPRDKLVLENREKMDRGVRARGFGTRPVLLIIDVNVAFVGDDPKEDIVESTKRYPKSSGVEGWQAVYQTASLLEVARESEVPVIYSTSGLLESSKGSRHGKAVQISEGSRIVKEIAPTEDDIVIYKSAASVFFGTSLIQHLRTLDIDTVLCCGSTTSGCVRATVVDASAYHFKVGVIEDCTFDRFQSSHKINLFDMNVKYADVVSVEKAKEYFRSLRVSEDKIVAEVQR